jgi:sulfoxide reductase catalytic subunit YedY
VHALEIRLVMNYFVRRPWDLPESRHTPEDVYRDRKRHRRDFLRIMTRSVAATALVPLVGGCNKPTDAEIAEAGKVQGLPAEWAGLYPAPRNAAFEYGRPETLPSAAARFTNFYEFATSKSVYRYVEKFQPSPWSFEVTGLCANPRTFDLDDVHQLFTLQERAYRHRCVETWAMCVPWTGFPLAALLKEVDPAAAASYVVFTTFSRPDEAPNQSDTSLPWPYTEGLTIEEARNELAFLATGVFGEPLPKQHGAPIRLVVPWKYGFKSCKSLVRIELTDQRPATFWNTVAPHEYAFQANVEPDVPHPRWSQATEWMLGTYEQYDTLPYNGYADLVGGLYA